MCLLHGCGVYSGVMVVLFLYASCIVVEQCGGRLCICQLHGGNVFCGTAGGMLFMCLLHGCGMYSGVLVVWW